MIYPLVSVNMPVYNGESFIKKAIESILSQTFQDFEFIIVNDGSTDNTVAIIEQFNDPRIKLVHNDQKSGLAHVRNKAINESGGKYIAILDSDDIAYPDRLQKQVDFLETHSGYCLVCSWVDYIDGNGKIVGNEYLEYADNEIPSALFFLDCIAQSSVMMRRDMLPGNLPYNTDLVIGEDYDLWIQLAKKYKMHIMQEPLIQYRNHLSNTSQNMRDSVDRMIRKIMRQQWEYLGMTDGTVDEETLQLSIIHNSYNRERDFVSGLSRYFRKVLYANRRSKRFPTGIFERMIKDYMNKVLPSFLVREEYGIQELKDLFGKEVNAALFLPKKQLLQILTKCMINYKPRNQEHGRMQGKEVK